MRQIIALSLLAAAISACKTTPEPVAPPVIITQPVQTCAPVSALQQVIIPAETKTRYAITQIDNDPYPPIETRVKQTIVVKPASIIYVDSEGKEVLDICEKDSIEIGETGPGIGEIIPEG
jgi:hypothetical protein